MAKRPFKKYNSKASVDAVQYTSETEADIIEKLGGELGDQNRLLLPGIPTALEVNQGDYIVLNEYGRLQVIPEEAFQEHYRVPKQGEPEEPADV